MFESYLLVISSGGSSCSLELEHSGNLIFFIIHPTFGQFWIPLVNIFFALTCTTRRLMTNNLQFRGVVSIGSVGSLEPTEF